MSEPATDNVVDFGAALKEFNRAKKVASRANKRLFLAAQALSTAAAFDAKADELVAASGEVVARSAKLLGDASQTLAHAVRSAPENNSVRGSGDGCDPLPGQGAPLASDGPTTRPVSPDPDKPALQLVDPDYSPAKDGPKLMLPVVQWLRERGDRIVWNALAGAYAVDGLTGLKAPHQLHSYANSLRACDGLAAFPDLPKAARAGAA